MRKPAPFNPGCIATTPHAEVPTPVRMQISHNLELEVGGTHFVLILNEEVTYGGMTSGAVETDFLPEFPWWFGLQHRSSSIGRCLENYAWPDDLQSVTSKVS